MALSIDDKKKLEQLAVAHCAPYKAKNIPCTWCGSDKCNGASNYGSVANYRFNGALKNGSMMMIAIPAIIMQISSL